MTRYEEYNELKKNLYPRSPLTIEDFISKKHEYLKIYFLLEESRRDLKEYKSKVILSIILMKTKLEQLSPNSHDSTQMNVEIAKANGMKLLINEQLEENYNHSRSNSQNFQQWYEENYPDDNENTYEI